MSLKSSQPKVNKTGGYLKFSVLRVWFHCVSLTETVGSFFVSAGPRYSDSASISSSISSLILCDYYELVNAAEIKLPTRAAEFPVF